MKLLALQDNLTKVKIVEELFQQTLRFPDEAHQALASELTKQRELRRKQVIDTKNAEANQTRKKKEAEAAKARGRGKQAEANPEESVRQCAIDFLV